MPAVQASTRSYVLLGVPLWASIQRLHSSLPRLSWWSPLDFADKGGGESWGTKREDALHCRRKIAPSVRKNTSDPVLNRAVTLAAHVVFVENPQRCRLQLPTVAIITMRDFASCLSQSGVQVAHSTSSSGQSMVQCAYFARLRGKSCRVTVTWSKVAMGQALAIVIDDSSGRCLCKTQIKPLLSAKGKGTKAVEVDGGALDIIWDLSSAKFAAGPEPLEGYYVALIFDLEAVLVLGDMRKLGEHKMSLDALPYSPVMVARKEHVYGKKVYSAKAQFLDIGQLHLITVECDTSGLKDPSLEIRIGKKRVLQVKKLAWKFRGNQTIYVDGLQVEVLWDVHDWLFGSSNGCAVFLFQSGESLEKCLSRSCSQDETEYQFGFTLMLHAWKVE